MVCVCWLVCSTLDEDIPVINELNSDIFCPSVDDDADAGDEVVPVVSDRVFTCFHFTITCIS